MAVKMSEEDVQTASPVTVSLTDLHSDSVPFERLEEAFGPESLGIIVVRDLPSNFASLRNQLLSFSSYLANLPQTELVKLENSESKWLVGWSCGKETLKDGRYDTLKGSYYANPVQNATLREKAVEKFPGLSEYNAPNVWPDEEVLPGFEHTFQELCNFIIDTAGLVARACDRYALKNVPKYQEGYLEHVVKTSISTKARLLHYFPSPDDASAQDSDPDDWCATHLDHGCLTGLTSAMFVDEAANPPNPIPGQMSPLPELQKSPDPSAGLYIHSRSGEVTKVNIPKDCLAFQTGEALEVITKGRFRAVPHFVKSAAPGTGGGKVARNTLAVFTQPNLWELVDEKRDFATFAKEIVERNH